MEEDWTCERCGHVAYQKSDLLRHLKRKKQCQPTLQDVDVAMLIDALTKKEYNEKTYDCEHCKRKFNNRSSKSRHMKTCKELLKLNTIANVMEEVNELRKLVQQMQTMPIATHNTYNTTNNNTTNNTQVNIHIGIKEFGQENMDALPDPFIRNCFMNLDVRDLLENLHCDPDYPENHNIRIVSLKRQLMELYKNDKWTTVTLPNGLNQMINNACRIFKTFYNANKQDVEEDVGDELEDVLDKLEEMSKLNETVVKPLRDELAAMLYGQKKIITP